MEVIAIKNNLEGVFLRLGYAIREAKSLGNTTIILGAGCSLSSTKRDISTWGIMKQCLLEHGVEDDLGNISWEELYQLFINIVWQGKAVKEQERLLKNKLSGLTPTEGHLCLRSLIEHGYIHNVITTNFDMLLEETFKGLSYQKRVGNGKYISIGNKPSFNLLKVHGDLEEGQFRFAPHELMRLPMELQEDIDTKTAGPLIFIGYRGQDIGLMNCLSTKNEYAAYWINISQFDSLDMYTNRNIYKFMEARSSAGNYLYGKEFGDFNGVIKKLNHFLLHPSFNTIIKTKEFNLSKVWENTTIIEMLRIYSRVYELFLDVLDISAKIQKRLDLDSDNSTFSKSYDEHLYSFLYFFDGEKLPSNLLHIPNNELDALILGVSIEILVRTTVNTILPSNFIIELKTGFDNKYKQNIVNDTFWFAVEKIVCSESDIGDTVHFNMPNKLILKTYNAPLQQFNELLHVISFLALLLPADTIDNNRVDEKYKIRQFLSGKYENIKIVNEVICVDLGQINKEDAHILYQFYLSTIPDIRTSNDTNVINGEKYMIFKSKWIQITLKIIEKEEKESNNHIFLWKKIKEQSECSRQYFLKLNSIYDTQKSNHVELQFDRDIIRFVTSNKVAMFAVGVSGCGKTSALQNFIQHLGNNIIPIIVSPKNTDTNKYGISLFLDIDITNDNEDTILGFIDHSLKIRECQLLLIFDGLNEINDVSKNQHMHYRKLIELANKIYVLRFTSIKLLITCREQTYYGYKFATGMSLNPLHFYTNAIDTNKECAYKITKLSNKDMQNLIDTYIAINAKKQMSIINRLFQNSGASITSENITPLFIALAAESLNTFSGIEIVKHKGSIYDLFTNTMMERLAQVDIFLAKKILFLYFDLIIDYRDSNIQITKFKILSRLENEYHNRFEEIYSKLIDINIFIKDYSNFEKIKFQHDKIEEFFCKLYLEEYEYKGLQFFDNVVELSERNIIYKNSLIQYFIGLENDGRLKELKELIINLSLKHMEKMPEILVEVLSNTNNLDYCLKYLVTLNDIDASKKILAIIIWGIDDSLQDYSIAKNSLLPIIDKLYKFPIKSIITNETRAYFLLFKSKINYFSNDYINALKCSESAQKLLKQRKSVLLTKIDIHRAVILMEQGKSIQCINCLEDDFQIYKNNGELKIELELGIELGRALNHSGQTSRTLDIYDFLLEHENEIKDSYILARIYEQKANVLNKIMFHKLQYGFVHISYLSEETLNEIEALFDEALLLYDKSIQLLLEANAIFTYSGVLPEKINMLIAYSISIKPMGIEDCKSMIDELETIFSSISTPFFTDFNIAQAYFYEYCNQIDMAEACINSALDNALKLNIQNKEAKCRCFYSQLSYRQIVMRKGNIKKWYKIGLEQLEKAIDYYEKNTLIKNNIILEDCYQLKQKFLAIKEL